jgi:hypothetical protein
LDWERRLCCLSAKSGLNVIPVTENAMFGVITERYNSYKNREDCYRNRLVTPLSYASIHSLSSEILQPVFIQKRSVSIPEIDPHQLSNGARRAREEK